MGTAALPVYFRLERVLAEQDPPMSQSALSRASDVSITTINAMVNNKTRQVSLETLDKLCRALKCAPGDLLARGPRIPGA